MDLLGVLGSLFENRMKVLGYIAPPILIIIAASIWMPDQLTNIITNFPHASWIDKLLPTIDASLYLWAIAGLLLVCGGALWTVFRSIIPFIRPDSSIYWKTSLERGLGYLVESSSWWFALYAFRIIYENKSTHIIDVVSQNPLHTLPAIIFWGLHLWAYLFADRMDSGGDYDRPSVAPPYNTDRMDFPPKR